MSPRVPHPFPKKLLGSTWLMVERQRAAAGMQAAAANQQVPCLPASQPLNLLQLPRPWTHTRGRSHRPGLVIYCIVNTSGCLWTTHKLAHLLQLPNVCDPLCDAPPIVRSILHPADHVHRCGCSPRLQGRTTCFFRVEQGEADSKKTAAAAPLPAVQVCSSLVGGTR